MPAGPANKQRERNKMYIQKRPSVLLSHLESSLRKRTVPSVTFFSHSGTPYRSHIISLCVYLCLNVVMHWIWNVFFIVWDWTTTDYGFVNTCFCISTMVIMKSLRSCSLYNSKLLAQQTCTGQVNSLILWDLLRFLHWFHTHI